MQIYKDKLALEASPAKTAETASYGATFAVLGWLLLSNYSGFGYVKQPIVSPAPPSAVSLAPAASIINNAAAYGELETLNETSFSAAILHQPEAESTSQRRRYGTQISLLINNMKARFIRGRSLLSAGMSTRSMQTSRLLDSLKSSRCPFR